MINLPNRITILRILLLIPFVIVILEAMEEPRLRYAAFIIFGLMALCDALDGYIARRYNLRSHLGRVLDPLADKLVLTVSVIMLTFPNWHGEAAKSSVPLHIPVWTTVIILSKDVVVTLGVLVLHFVTERTQIVKPSMIGKAATAATFLLVLAVLASPDLRHLGLPMVLRWTILLLGAAASLLSVIALLQYISRGSKVLSTDGGDTTRR